MGLIGKYNIDSAESSGVHKFYDLSYDKVMDLHTGDLTIRNDGKIGIFLSKEFCKDHSDLLEAWWGTFPISDIYEYGITLYGNSGNDSHLSYLLLKKNSEYNRNGRNLAIIQVYTAAISEKELNSIISSDNIKTNKLLYEKIEELKRKL